MKDIELKADKLWRQIIAIRFNFRCFICDKSDSMAFPPHSAHHIIKRMYKLYRWDLNNGVYVCAGHHEIAEQSRDKFKALLLNVDEKKQDQALLMVRLLDKGMNIPSVRYIEHDMKEIVRKLEFEIAER